MTSKASRVGLTIAGRQGIAGKIAAAQAAEAAGLHSVWSGDGGGDVFGILTAYALNTKTIGLGTSLAIWTRPPTVAASAIAQLADFSRNRLTVGIGPGPRHMNEDWWGIPFDKPIGRMSEYVTAIHGILAAPLRTKFNFSGKHFNIKDFQLAARRPDPTPPLFLGTVGRQMNRLAGRVADGVLIDVCLSPRYIKEVVIPEIEAGLKASGRDRSHFTIAAALPCAIDTDVAAARRQIKGSIVSHLGDEYFYPVWASDGFEAEARRAQAQNAAGDHVAAGDGLSDEFANLVGISGTADTARKQLAEWLEFVDLAVLFPPVYRTGADEIDANRKQLLETFSGW